LFLRPPLDDELWRLAPALGDWLRLRDGLALWRPDPWLLEREPWLLERRLLEVFGRELLALREPDERELLAAREPDEDEPEPEEPEPFAERELREVREAPDDLEAPAVLLFDVFALWARARVDCGLRCAAFAGLDDELLDVFRRLVELRLLTADISTSPIRFPALGAFRNFTGAGLIYGLPDDMGTRTASTNVSTRPSRTWTYVLVNGTLRFRCPLRVAVLRETHASKEQEDGQRRTWRVRPIPTSG
jgi:hypothetical protein